MVKEAVVYPIRVRHISVIIHNILFEVKVNDSAGGHVNDRCAVVVVVDVAVPTAVHRNIVTMERSFTVRSTW